MSHSHTPVKNTPTQTNLKKKFPDPKIFFKMFPNPGRSGLGKLRVSGCPVGL